MTIENPPAFPVIQPPGFEWADKGMTLRDYFAAAALTGMMAAEAEDVIYEAKGVAGRAYRFADAMLLARLSPHSVVAGGE